MKKKFFSNITKIKAAIILFFVSIIVICICLNHIYSFVTRVKENIVPEWIPSNYRKDEISWGPTFNKEYDLFIVPVNSVWKGKIVIGSIGSLNGKWKTNWCKMEIIKPEKLRVETKSRTTKDWQDSETILRSKGSVNIDTKILFRKEWLHKEVEAKVGMEVEYPMFIENDYSMRTNYYEDRTALLSRKINFYVVSNKEMSIIRKNIIPSENQSEGALFIISIIAIFIGVVTLIYSIKTIMMDRVEKIIEKIRRKKYEL